MMRKTSKTAVRKMGGTRGALELLLAGDIGGTHARLRLYERDGRKIVRETTLPSRGSRSLEALLAPYLARQRARVVAAVFGIAGPVEEGVSRTTNLAWVVDEKRVASALDIPAVKLVNDMTAIAVGAASVGRSGTFTLVRGRPIRRSAQGRQAGPGRAVRRRTDVAAAADGDSCADGAG